MNIVAFVGRLNPPHSGHLGAIKNVKKTADEIGGQGIVFLTATQDPEKNPLSFEQKLKYAK
jgi:cytidyltransferase-like protein